MGNHACRGCLLKASHLEGFPTEAFNRQIRVRLQRKILLRWTGKSLHREGENLGSRHACPCIVCGVKRKWRLQPWTDSSKATAEGTLRFANVRTLMTALPHGHSSHCAPVWGNTNGWGLGEQRRWQTFADECRKGRRTWRLGRRKLPEDGVKCLRAQTFQKGLKDVHGPLHV